MKTKAAVLYGPKQPFKVVELDLDEPRENEVLIKYLYSGLCHSDLHLQTGDLDFRAPLIGGHEGAGIVLKVGPGVTRVAEGDHVVCSFIPNCGSCPSCATGQQAICDWGADILQGSLLPSGRFPFTGPEGNYGAMCMIGTFSQYAVIHQNSAIKVDDDFPLDLGALVGCGVPTGWGSAVNVAKTGPGDTVVIYGIGGVGINAVQGAALSGAARIIAVDPLQNKREAALRFGATHAVASYEEARTIALAVTRGRGAHKAIITVGELDSAVVKAGFDVITKGGTLVITGIGNWGDTSIQLPGTELAMWKKTIKGTVFGDCNPTSDIPVLLDLFKNGQLKLEELVTKRYTIDQLNDAYEDLISGQNIRGLLVHEH